MSDLTNIICASCIMHHKYIIYICMYIIYIIYIICTIYMYVYIIYHKHPDHFPSAILDISYTELVQPLLILDYLPSFSVKTFWEK